MQTEKLIKRRLKLNYFFLITMAQTPKINEKRRKVIKATNLNWFITSEIERIKPPMQIIVSKNPLKMLNKNDFRSSWVLCFNAFKNPLIRKNKTKKTRRRITTKEYKFGDFTAKNHKGHTIEKPKTPQSKARRRNLPNEIKNDEKPLTTEFAIKINKLICNWK